MSPYKRSLRLWMRIKILRSANAKYHYSYLFFYKINKGDLPLMYSCVFWCEFIDLVGCFGCYCLVPVPLFIIQEWPPVISMFFLPWMANSREWGLWSCQIPRGGEEKRGRMPRTPSTLQHFSLIAQSNSAVLSILMCDFLFQLTSSFVTALGF